MAGVQGRVALVTGCGSAEGIGFAVARSLAVSGARVAITATTARIFDRLEELGGGHAAFIADLTDSAAAMALVGEVSKKLGPVEILVNNAGMVQIGRHQAPARIEQISDEDWQAHLAMNASTAFYMTRAVLPDMQAAGYGRIVNVASVTGPVVSIVHSGGYASAKAAMTGLTRATALENAGLGITCNAVLPGWIATGSSSQKEIEAGNKCPTGRPGTPDEIAAACLFLAGQEASYVNGSMLVVDGANTLVEMKGAGGN
ncbi:MAG: SDR family oxidoreductase [Albidovulum sp.]